MLRLRCDSESCQWSMIVPIFFSISQLGFATQGAVILGSRNIDLDALGSVVEIKESLIEGLVYQFPIVFKNATPNSFRATSATAVCNCVSATFDKHQISRGQEFRCKVYVRPKSSEMLQVIELKGFDGKESNETTLLRFKIDIKVLSPFQLETHSIIIVDGVPNRNQVSIKREEGIDNLQCAISEQESPVKILYELDKLLVTQCGFPDANANTTFHETGSAKCYLEFTFSYKGEIGKVSRILEISPPKAIRITPAKMVFRRKNESFHGRFILSNLESEVCQSDEIETLWTDGKEWVPIRSKFHADKLSSSMLLCWVSIPENLITDMARNSKVL